MLTINEFKTSYEEIKNVAHKSNEIAFETSLEFLSSKFPEANSIFFKFDEEALKQFYKQSEYKIYKENEEVFRKGENCTTYNFIIYGDINLYETDFNEDKTSKLIKTISSGTIYGHKIKETYKYFIIARSETHILKINKDNFDKLIEETNLRKEKNKKMFLKKFFPKLRTYSDNDMNIVKNYFIRETYNKNSRIITDGEFDEFVYILIKGNLSVVKSVKKIKKLSDKINFDSLHLKYIVLEHFKKGDIFGVYSALRHYKNNYSVKVLSNTAEVYKIPKACILPNFGGSHGEIPESLRGLDINQQVSLQIKFEFLEHSQNLEKIKNSFTYLPDDNSGTVKRAVDETDIKNNLKDAYKELEGLDSKISSFKASLFTNKTTQNSNLKAASLLTTQKDEGDLKDYSKVMGFGTQRLPSRTLNKTAIDSQVKGMNALSNLIGIKKQPTNLAEDPTLLKIANLKKGAGKSTMFGDLAKEDLKSVDLEIKHTNTSSNTSNVENGEIKAKPKKVGLGFGFL